MPKPVRIAVLVSGGGSNLEAILQAQKKRELSSANVVLVLSSKAGIQALQRARQHQVESTVIEHTSFASDEAFQEAILSVLEKAHVDVVCLAGYLKKIGPGIIQKFRGRIMNIHPALLPKYGGPGMYGHFVHEAVLKAGEKESGCTVHLVDEEFDHGAVLAQVRIPVLPGDTPEVLASRVLEQEHQLYPRIIKEFCEKLSAAGAHS